MNIDHYSLQNPQDFSLKEALKELLLFRLNLPILRLILIWSLIGVIATFVSSALPHVLKLLGEVSLMVAVSRHLLVGEEIPFLRASILEIRCLGAYLIFIALTSLIAFPLVLSYFNLQNVLMSILSFFAVVSFIWLLPTFLHFIVLTNVYSTYKEAFLVAKNISFPVNASLILGILLISFSIFLISLPLILVFVKIAVSLGTFVNMFVEFIQTILLTQFACIVIRMRMMIK